MNKVLINNSTPHPGNNFHFQRSRINKLFFEALNYPVIMVCAGAGYGKTRAVTDFVDDFKAGTAWIQLSERDNVPARFWENFVHAMSQVNLPFSESIKNGGFPDTEEKYNQYIAGVKKYLSPLENRVLVFDDLHVLENPAIIRFLEKAIHYLSMGTSLVLISRSTACLNITNMISRGKVFSLNERDLCFTPNEVAQYFRHLEMIPQNQMLREIMQDTGGWAFAINLIARSYQKAPGYGGYLRNAMKNNIFNLMETEIWEGISASVQSFLVRLSLIDHLSFDLIELLANGDSELINEMEKQNAYIRRDSYINAYFIHHLFLEFLKTKQNLLSEEDRIFTYAAAADWCNKNGFKIDALSYYEKTGDYGSIIDILYEMPGQFPHDIARVCLEIFDRAPPDAFDRVMYLAITHVRVSIRAGLWHKAIELVKKYEEKFMELIDDDLFKVYNLGGLYFLMAYLRNFMCINDDVYDFDRYLEKFCNGIGHPAAIISHSARIRVLGPWVIAAGASAKGAAKGAATKGGLQEYINAVSRATAFAPKLFSGFMAGEEDLANGELKFFRGDLTAAEAHFAKSLASAREHGQYEIMHRSLLYLMRLNIARGNFPKAEQALKEIQSCLSNAECSNRYTNYDVSLAWFAYILGLSDMVPDWLRQNVSPYCHPGFIENFENQAKIRYFYMTKNYPPLLAYIHEALERDNYLLGKLEILVMEACVHYALKDKARAYEVLLKAYEIAEEDSLIMPFIEMGKDMRTLTGSMLKDGYPGIPEPWLENINRKAASYAKRQSHVLAQYREANSMSTGIVLSPRETEILSDLAHGLSRAEAASSRNLSINTVKMVINSIYSKLGAENVADLVRIAMERKIL